MRRRSHTGRSASPALIESISGRARGCDRRLAEGDAAVVRWQPFGQGPADQRRRELGRRQLQQTAVLETPPERTIVPRPATPAISMQA